MGNPYGYPPGTYQGGVMPPSAQAARRPAVASGTQVVPTVDGLAFPSDGAAVGICEVRGEALPRVLTIGFPVGGVFVGSSFPPYPEAASTGPGKAGIVNAAGTAFGGSTVRRLAAVLEYGSGSAAQKVYFDWCPGSYNLPPCDFARVSVLPWGTTWTGALLNRYPANASFSPGELQDAHVPTVTANGTLVAGVQQTFIAPSCARAVEILNVDNTTTPVLQLKGEVTATRNYAALSAFPGASPLPLYAGATFTAESDVSTVAALIFYLSL